MTVNDMIDQTYSVCPVCLKRLAAFRIRRGDGVYLERECPEHGAFRAIIWRNMTDFDEWTERAEKIGKSGNPGCPSACGLCDSHIRDTCCTLLEVTSRCDLSDCLFCFSDSGQKYDDPSIGELASAIKNFVRPGKTFLQLSGGEPSLRGDLPEIVRTARELGCKYIQLNSNGIRLAEDERFAGELASAGLSFVFMQFDGMNDSVYEKLRGRKLLGIKMRAIENCARHNIGVTLVPTLVQGVNTDGIGGIIRFAASRSPGVRGVHFQPACFMGRAPLGAINGERFTLDELMREIRAQTPELPCESVFLPSSCDHPLCGFHSDFIVTEDGGLYPLSRQNSPDDDEAEECCCSCSDPAEKNREFVGRRWQRRSEDCCRCDDENNKGPGSMDDMEYFAKRAGSHAFTLTAMAFQDAWNLDLERLRTCSLHVARAGRMVPFCSNYLTAFDKKQRHDIRG